MTTLKNQLHGYPRSGRKAMHIEERRRKKKFSIKNGRLQFRPPPLVEHASRLDQHQLVFCQLENTFNTVNRKQKYSD